MAKQKGSGSAITAPKGRPTASRGDRTERGRRLTPTMEWIIALVVIAAVIVALVVIFGDVRGSPTHSGTGVPDPVVAVAGVRHDTPDPRGHLHSAGVERDGPVIGVVMGSGSDWPTMSRAVEVLDQFDIAHEARVVSAHRMPDEMFAYAESATHRGLRAIIAGAGGAAHLPGMLAAKTVVPVLGVPVASRHLSGQDSLYSIVQMPAGVPTATFAIGEAGATNAALFAVAMLAVDDESLRDRLEADRRARRDAAASTVLPPS